MMAQRHNQSLHFVVIRLGLKSIKHLEGLLKIYEKNSFSVTLKKVLLDEIWLNDGFDMKP